MIALILLLIVSAMTSAAEVSYFSLTQKQVDEIENESLRKRIQLMLGRPKKLLATILIGNNAANLAIVILSGIVMDQVFDWIVLPQRTITGLGNTAASLNMQTEGLISGLKFVIQVVLVTFLILLFGEVIPKVYATHNPVGVAKFMVGPMRFMSRLLSFMSFPLVSTSSFIDKRLQRKEAAMSAGELSAVIDLTRDETVTDEEKKIWKGIVEFGTISVKETMKPRIDVMALEVNTPFTQLLPQIVSAGYSRIPVYRENFDKIEGVLYIKDLLPHLDEGDGFTWQQLIRPPFYVPENKKIDDLLKEFQSKKMHMAIVVDEFGGSSGIVTLEDVIEEIVGEINDEFDDDEIVYSRLDDDNYVFEGKTTLINLCRIMEIEYSSLEPYVGDSDTLAGLVLQLNGQLPERNQVLICDHLRFTIESVDRKRIKRIKVTRIKDDEIPLEP